MYWTSKTKLQRTLLAEISSKNSDIWLLSCLDKLTYLFDILIQPIFPLNPFTLNIMCVLNPEYSLKEAEHFSTSQKLSTINFQAQKNCFASKNIFSEDLTGRKE